MGAASDASGSSAQSLRLSQAAVSDYLSRARRAGLTWPLPDELDDAQLEALLFPPPPDVPTEQRPVPDWAVVHRELRRPNVTLALLWEEYRGGPAPGRVRLLVVLRSLSRMGWPAEADAAPGAHRGRAGVRRLRRSHHGGDRRGDRGDTPRRDLRRRARCLELHLCAKPPGHSRCRTGLRAHVNMLASIGGVPRQIVSDNLRAGITRACFYEPLVNRTYADMASHYGTAVIPARPYKPRDKAKVEVGVQVVQRWILARLRNRRFFSLAELNQAIRELVDQLNDRPMRGWGTTRRALYEQLDRPALRELPPTPYEYADWKRCRVNLDYHVEIDKHFYSVPFRLLREEVEARITAKTVEIFHRGKLVATHLRSLRPYRPTTLAEHMPSSHRRYRDWTHERILREAAAIGDDTAALVEIILRSRPHPEQGFRSCIGILRLAKRYDAERLDAACARALALGTRSYSSVAAILKNAQDRKAAEPEQPSLFHENIRGPGYYH